jgi:transaldolase
MINRVYVKEAALAGAHIATIPPEVLDDMMTSELSEVALKGFLDQWDKLSNENKDIFGEENEAKK